MMRFILGTASRTKISANCAHNAALNTAQSRHMLVNKLLRVGLADQFIRRAASGNPEQNPFGRICSRETAKGGCVTTALRI